MCGKPQPGATHRYAVKQSLSLSRVGGWQRFEVPCCRAGDETGEEVMTCSWRRAVGDDVPTGISQPECCNGPTMMRNVVIVVIGCLLVGCGAPTLPSKACTQVTSTVESAAIVTPLRYGWYQTHGDEASHVMVTKLSIPDVFQDRTEEIHVARYVYEDAEGIIHFPPESYYKSAHAAGRNARGGFGYGGGVNVICFEPHDDAVTLQVNYYWTTADQVKGTLKESVLVKIGAPLDVQLSGGSRLQVTWRALPRP